MTRRPARILVAAVGAFVLLLLSADAASDLYTEVLWYDELGFADVFWTRVWAAVTVRSIAGVVGAGLVLLNLWIVVRQLGPVHRGGVHARRRRPLSTAGGRPAPPPGRAESRAPAWEEGSGRPGTSRWSAARRPR